VRIYGPAAAGFEKDKEGKLVKDVNEQAISVCDGRDEVFTAWIERDIAVQEQVTVPLPSEEKVGEFDSCLEDLRPGVINKIYISTLDVGRVDVTEGGDYQVTELNPVEELTQALSYCELPTEFAAVVEDYPSEVVEAAIALQDTQPRRSELAAWFQSGANGLAAVVEEIELALPKRPLLSDYSIGDEVWAYFPQSEKKWLKASVEWARTNLLKVTSGFLGIMIEDENLIAPGDWEFTPG
jgi:hypothetical protein